MRRLRTTLVLVLTAGLLTPTAALAGASEDYVAVYKAYQAKGTVDGCAFSAAKLVSAKKGVPPDIDTYAPDFPDALDAALRQRASGDCEASAAAGKGTATAPEGTAGAPAAAGTPPGGPAPAPAAPAAPAAGGAAPAATTPAPPPDAAAAAAAADGSVTAAAARRASADRADDAPFPLVLLAVLAGLALLGGLLWALVRFLALDPPWLATSRHATAEAGWRASNAWAEFADWVRLGR